jgi:hypothetical protein
MQGNMVPGEPSEVLSSLNITIELKPNHRLYHGYKKNKMSTDMENGRENKRARVTRGSRNPKHGKRKHYIVHKPSRLN